MMTARPPLRPAASSSCCTLGFIVWPPGSGAAQPSSRNSRASASPETTAVTAKSTVGAGASIAAYAASPSAMALSEWA